MMPEWCIIKPSPGKGNPWNTLNKISKNRQRHFQPLYKYIPQKAEYRPRMRLSATGTGSDFIFAASCRVSTLRLVFQKKETHHFCRLLLGTSQCILIFNEIWQT
jgi:hypothetical protein